MGEQVDVVGAEVTIGALRGTAGTTGGLAGLKRSAIRRDIDASPIDGRKSRETRASWYIRLLPKFR